MQAKLTVLIIFPLSLKTITITQMLFIEGEWAQTNNLTPQYQELEGKYSLESTDPAKAKFAPLLN